MKRSPLQAKRARMGFWLQPLRSGAVLAIVMVVLAQIVTGCSSSTTSTTSTTPSATRTAASATPSTSATRTSATPASASTGYNLGLLVETSWLASNLADTNLRIVDARKADDYSKGHIKGAISIPVDSTYGPEGPQAVPPAADKIAQLFGSKGIGNDNKVVVYAEGKDYNASRLFWAFEYYGNTKVSLLNGGFGKWQQENRDTATTAPDISATTFTPKVNSLAYATEQDVLTEINSPNAAIVDSRAPAEYTGAEPNAKRGGHVPKAVNIEWVQLFNADNTFKSADELAKLYADNGITKDKTEISSYCQVGLRSAVTYFSLRYLGYQNPRHYVASWQEWGNDPNTPIEK